MWVVSGTIGSGVYRRTLQSSTISVMEGQDVAGKTVETLLSLRTDECFKLFWVKVTQMADSLSVDEPCLPHVTENCLGG